MSQDNYYNLSPSQEGIWLLEQFSPGTNIATIATTIKIKGTVDFDCLEKAINKVIATQDALRIQLTRIDDRPKQYIIKPQSIRIDHLQFKTKKELFEWDERMTQIPFNLLNQPLFYFATFTLGKHKSGFYQKYHHLICDGYSIGLLTDRILDTYLKLKKHETVKLEHHSYLDFLDHENHYINSVTYQKDKEFWHSKLSDISDVAVLKPRSVKDNQFAASRKSFVLDETFAKRFRDYCDTQKQSSYSVLLTAIAIYLYKVTGKTDNIIGTPILNRTNRKDKNTIGQFVSTVPLRMILNPHVTFEEQTNSISLELMKVLRHQKYPYHELQQEIFKTKGLSGRLFELGFSYQNFTTEQPHDDLDFELRWRFNRCQIESLFIQASDKNSGGKLIIAYDYVTSLFDEEEISLIHHHLLSILRGAFKHSLCDIDKLEIISQTEKHKILKEFNNTTVLSSTVKLAHELFEEQAARYPDSIALTFENKQLSYRQLNERSNQLCAVLVQKGVKRDSFVGLLVTRSFDMAIGILAILKAGGAYVPIDAEYPEDRIQYMLDDCGASVVLTNKRLSKEFGTNITLIRIDKLSNHLKDTSNPNLSVRPSDLAYIIYTSGSSGQPKAVMIRHYSLSNFIEGIAKRIHFAEQSVMLGLTTISFDIFGLEFFVPLSLGLRVVLANEVQEKEPRELARLINNQKVTMIQMTPSRMQMLLHEDIFKSAMANIRQMMLGGEPLTLYLLHRIKNVYSGTIYNMYGPTETTIWSTLSDLTEASTIHIGSPIQNTQIYILNAYMRLVPIGMVGDMYIGGRGLALGYLNRPELTARQFIPNPFDKNELIYKTGDLATWTSSGDIKCLGRVDNQVKIRGVRIELGEVESYLIKHPEIKAAAVIAVEQEHNIKALYAYYIAEQELHPSEVKQFLLSALPISMIPDVLIQLDELPMTPNGKVDRKLLPIPSVIDQLDSRLFVAPNNELEERISNICTEVLQVSKLSVLDDFFDLGANSLKIISLAGKLNHELKTTLSVNDIYQHPGVRLLAHIVSGEHDQYAMQVDTRQIVSKISLKQLITTRKRPLRRILLLGASGFLGAHILKDMMLISPECAICCIVRGLDNQDAYRRLKELFQFYFHNQYQHEFAKPAVLNLQNIN